MDNTLRKFTDKEIKEEIYKHFRLHRNTKLHLNNEKMEFQMWRGSCESIWIMYPIKIKRDLILQKIIN